MLSKDYFNKAWKLLRKSHIDPPSGKVDNWIQAVLIHVFDEFFHIIQTDTSKSTKYMKIHFDDFLQRFAELLDSYTDMIMDDLFDIKAETRLVGQIKDILDELNIISRIKQEQLAVLEPFSLQIFNKELEDLQRESHDGTRVRNHIAEF